MYSDISGDGTWEIGLGSVEKEERGLSANEVGHRNEGEAIRSA